MQPLLFAKSVSFDTIRENMHRAEKEMQTEIAQFKADITREFAFTKPVVVPPAEKHYSLDQAHQSMIKNAHKAIEEHRKKEPDTYATIEAVDKSVQAKRSWLRTLSYTVSEAAIQGPRKTMEDATRVVELDNGLLVSVFDGHGGKEVADYAAKAMDRFKDELKKAKGNVRNAFEALLSQIQKEVDESGISVWTGATAAIAYIDTVSKKVYTATLGDSEVNMYRTLEDRMCSIPLSCVRDWSNPNEALRASQLMGKSVIASQWPYASNPKFLRLVLRKNLLGTADRWKNDPSNNVSRALGDKMFSGTKDFPGIIHKAKISESDVVNGDTLVVACDGLKDYVPEKDIVNTIGMCTKLGASDIAQRLVNRARHVTKDNVSVIAIKFKEQTLLQSIWKRIM